MRKIILGLIVMIAMMGTVSASPDGAASPSEIYVNIYTDVPTPITFQWWDLSTSTMDQARFQIFEDNNNDGVPDDLDGNTVFGDAGDLTNKLMLSWDGITYTNAGSFSFNIPPNALDSVEVGQPTAEETRYTKTIWVKDANTGASIDDRFITIGSLGGATAYVQQVTTSTDVIAVPEFPTIALPVAAILGLVFIFQRRKEE